MCYTPDMTVITHDIHLKILKDRGLTRGEIEEFLTPEYNEEKG